MEMSFEQLVRLIAHSRRLAAISNNHGEVMGAIASRDTYESIARQCGYDMKELQRQSRDMYLDLVLGRKVV
jgi:hypothetical protein